MAKFIVCEVAPMVGSRIMMEDMRTVALNLDSIDVLHQDTFKVENRDGSLSERVGMEVFSTKLKGQVDGRLIIMSDYDSFMKEIAR